jgi:hypothetical protein
MILTINNITFTTINTTMITTINATKITILDNMTNLFASPAAIISYTTATVATASIPATKDTASTTAAIYGTSPSLLIVTHFVQSNVTAAADNATILPVHAVATSATPAASDAYPIYLAVAKVSTAANESTTITHPFINISFATAKATLSAGINYPTTTRLLTFVLVCPQPLLLDVTSVPTIIMILKLLLHLS